MEKLGWSSKVSVFITINKIGVCIVIYRIKFFLILFYVCQSYHAQYRSSTLSHIIEFHNNSKISLVLSVISVC